MTPEAPGHRTLAGTIRVFAAEALIFPTGLVTAAYLTRELGAHGYGLLSLAGTLVAGIEWSIVALFARATVRILRDEADWRPLATRVLHLGVGAGLACMVGLWVLAPALARVLDAPGLTGPLRLFAVDIPLFALALGHRTVLTGLGEFGRRAQLIAVRWITRMVLILALVALGLSVTGAILGSIGASLAEALVARRHHEAPFLSRSRVATGRLVRYAAPLFLAAIAKRFVREVDLVALKSLGGTVHDAGLYAAARNLSIAPDAFTGAFSPLLLATLATLVRDRSMDHARAMARDGLRLFLLLAPLAGVAAGSADEIVRLAFGDPFAPAGALFQRLVFAGMAAGFMAVGTTALVAGGRPSWPLWISGPLVPIALLGHGLAVPRWGAEGAATVTLIVCAIGAAASLAAVHRAWGIDPLFGSLLRSGAVTAAAWAAAAAWPASGWAVLVELAVLAGLVPVALLAVREIGRHEIELARSLLPRRRTPAPGPAPDDIH